MTEPRHDAALEPAGQPQQIRPAARPRPLEPPPPGGRGEVEALHVEGAVPAVPGTPPVSTAVPVPAVAFGHALPGVQLAQRPRRRGDSFGWPANAAPGKPEGEVDTRP